MKKILLVSTLLILLVNGANAANVVEDALISNTNYKVAGTFGRHDFPPLGDNNPDDWAFTTPQGEVLQLKGTTVTKASPFGWKKVDIPVPTAPSWYMFRLNSDVDGDGSMRFDWVLLSTNNEKKVAYKLVGATSSGNFIYSDALDIDYTVKGTTITTGAKGTLAPPVSYVFDTMNYSLDPDCYAVSYHGNINVSHGKISGLMMKIFGDPYGDSYMVQGTVSDVTKKISGTFGKLGLGSNGLIEFKTQGSFKIYPSSPEKNEWKAGKCYGPLVATPLQ